jgi:putative ABC transport system permease protein
MDERTVRRVLSGLLRLYPASFRDTLGDDLLETALERWRDAGGPRAAGALRFWASDGLRFGVDGVLERLRLLSSLMSDGREAWRQVIRRPAQHVLPVMTLSLGIAATATILTVTDAVVFRALPYPAAEQLYLIHSRFGALELSSNSLLNLRDLQSSVRTMSWIAGATDRSPALSAPGGDAERVSSLMVTGEYLPGLGASVRIGRSFVNEDFAAGAPRVALVSHSLWQRRWGGTPQALGSIIQLDGVDHTVVGVMERGFRDPGPIESGVVTAVWTPAREGDRRHRDDYGFRLLGRLADGASLDAARRELSAAGARLSAAHPEINRMQGQDLAFVLHALHERTVGSAESRLLLLLGAVALLLVLSCANVANLFFARGVARTSELAVRCALGATRARLTTQLFAESLLTAALAGVIGGALGFAGVRALVAAAPAGIPRLHEVTLDWRALAFMALLTALTAMIFGSVPALRASRNATVSATAPRLTTTRAAQRVQSTLVAAEIALALVLVTGSALLLGSLRHLLRVDPGFDASDVTVVDVRPPVSANSHQLALDFYRSLMERARAAPGVTAAAMVHTTPGLAGGMWSRVTAEENVALERTGAARAPAAGERPGQELYRLNPVYGNALEVLDIPLLAGRAFENEPGMDDPYVIVINEAAARRFFPDVERPIGRRLMLAAADAQAPLREVIGIAGNVRQRGPEHDAEPQIYVPYGQRDVNRLSLIMEAGAAAGLSHDVIRSLVRDVDANVPIDRIESLGTRYAATSEQTRLLTLLVSLFAAIGLLLAAIGTYATTSHALARRMRELGIRMALGARTGAVFRLVLHRALVIAAAGIVAGMFLSLGLTRFLSSYIYGVAARDPATFAAAALLIGLCALLASVGPAIRATRVDPNHVLRSE